MTLYTVHLPPEATTAETVAERAVFVKDGFAFFGFAFTGFWMLAHKLWLRTILYVLVLVGTVAAFWYFGWPAVVFGTVTLLYALFIGLEGNEWIRRRYRRMGWAHAGTVSGPTLDECERRFFQDWLAHERAPRPAPSAAAQAPAAPQPSQVLGSPVLGVFPAPRGQA